MQRTPPYKGHYFEVTMVSAVERFHYKFLINNKTKKNFLNALQKMTWDIAISSKQTDSAYEAFPNKFTSEKFVVTVKWKTLKQPVDNTIN